MRVVRHRMRPLARRALSQISAKASDWRALATCFRAPDNVTQVIFSAVHAIAIPVGLDQGRLDVRSVGTARFHVQACNAITLLARPATMADTWSAQSTSAA